MKQSKAVIQTLPTPTVTAPDKKRVPRQAIAPNREIVMANFGEDAPLVFGAMGQSLTYGLCFALLEDYKIPEQPELTARMMAQHVGRCLWTWEDVAGPDLSTLRRAALRPSAMLPADMQEVSPRLAVDLLGGNYAAAARMLRDLLDIDVPDPIDRALGLTGYGAVQDARLPLLCRLQPAQVRPGYSRRQSYVMQIAGNIQPFALAISQQTLYADDLALRFREIAAQVVEDTVAVYRAKDVDLEPEDVEVDKVADSLMREPWDLRLPAEPDPIDTAPVVRRLLIQRLAGREKVAYLTAEELLGFGLLTGLSPAAFARYAVKDFERRGVTYTTVNEVGRLADLVRGESGEDRRLQMTADRLAKELDGSAVALDSVGRRLDDKALFINHLLHKTRPGEWSLAFPEWGLGKKLHVKAVRGETQDLD